MLRSGDRSFGDPPEKPFSKRYHTRCLQGGPLNHQFFASAVMGPFWGRKLYKFDPNGWVWVGLYFRVSPMNLIKPVTLRNGFKRQKNNHRLGSGSNLSSRKQLENESLLYIIINYQPPKLYPNYIQTMHYFLQGNP